MKEQNSIYKSVSRTEGKNSILFCGDTFLRTRDGTDPFSLILSDFRNARICVNLETSLKGSVKKKKNVCLSVDENVLDMIPDAARIISLVNNHVSDSGNPDRMVQALERRGRVVVGPGNPSQSHTTLDGMDVAFFSAYFGLPRLRVSYNGRKADTLERMLLDSKAQRKIVNLHWGYEHTDTPAPFQRELAHRFVDAGANIIIGHHPHVAQGWEVYCGVQIFYSLGNFNFWQFDTETSERNRWGYMVDYNFSTGAAKAIPYRINENYQPYLLSCEEQQGILSRLQGLSEAVCAVDFTTWFESEYAEWYAHEFSVWKRLCLDGGSLRLWIKWSAWLCMPMQLKYYVHATWCRMKTVWKRQ